MRVRLGFRYDTAAAAADPAAFPRALLAHAEEVDAAGADLLWLSERPFAPGAGVPAALPLCAALAARTRRARIGAGPLPLPLYHPLRLAEDAASLDGLSGGRLELALGLGADAEGYDAFGVPPRERVPRFEEALALLRLAWREETIEHAGRFHTVHGLSLAPRPVQPGGPPVWIAAGADTAVRRAARLGDGLLCPPTPGAAGVFLAAWNEAGRTPGAARLALALPPAPSFDDVAAALAGAFGYGAVDLLLPANPDAAAADARALAHLADTVKSQGASTDEPQGRGGESR